MIEAGSWESWEDREKRKQMIDKLLGAIATYYQSHEMEMDENGMPVAKKQKWTFKTGLLFIRNVALTIGKSRVCS